MSQNSHALSGRSFIERTRLTPTPDVIHTARRVGKDRPVDLSVASEPWLLTVEEVAALLRTSRKAIYAMIERGRLPGVARIGRRVLVHRDDLLQWVRQKSAPSLER